MAASDRTAMIRAGALQSGAIGTVGKANNVFGAQQVLSSYPRLANKANNNNPSPKACSTGLEVDFSTGTCLTGKFLYKSYVIPIPTGYIDFTLKNLPQRQNPPYFIEFDSDTYDFENTDSAIGINGGSSSSQYNGPQKSTYCVYTDDTVQSNDIVTLASKQKISGTIHIILI